MLLAVSLRTAFSRNHTLIFKYKAVPCFWGQEPTVEYACITIIVLTESKKFTNEPFSTELDQCFLMNVCTIRIPVVNTDILESILSYHSYILNLEMYCFEDNVNFVHTTTKQNTYFKTFIVLFIIVSLFLFFLLGNYLNEYYVFSRANFKNR